MHRFSVLAVRITSYNVCYTKLLRTCTFDKSTGKFTIATDGALLSLLWNTGANTANKLDAIGFDTVADDTGALTYTADNAITYGPAVTPSYDDSDPRVVKDSMMLLGDFDEMCRIQQR